jgi:hypothetical protein
MTQACGREAGRYSRDLRVTFELENAYEVAIV